MGFNSHRFVYVSVELVMPEMNTDVINYPPCVKRGHGKLRVSCAMIEVVSSVHETQPLQHMRQEPANVAWYW